MTFKEQLRAHVGGLVCLKSQLYWYSSDTWDGINERVCLLLDLSAARTEPLLAALTTVSPLPDPVPAACALLLIDGTPKWVWISEKTTEFIQ